MIARRWRLAAAGLLLVVAPLVAGGPASAHTGFESSEPADGATTTEPVEVVTIRFTGLAEPTGDGFRALDASGEVREPTDASSSDGQTWTLRFDPPLAGGATGIRWMVQAPDAHPIEGSFSFSAGGATSSTAGDEAELEQFLDAPEGTPAADALGSVARMLSVGGALVGVGAVVFAATVLRGRRRDVREVTFWVRRSGAVVVVGTLVEAVALVAVDAGGFDGLAQGSAISSALLSGAGLAIALRLAGGVALVVGTHPDTAPAAGRTDLLAFVGAPPAPVDPTPVASTPGADATTSLGGDEHVWAPRWSAAGAVVGSVLLVGSFAFDGHTASKGPWPLHALVNLVHVSAVAVWVGGVAMLAAVAWRRHRDHRPVQATELAVRFSVVATATLVVLGITGLLMAVIVLDAPGDLIGTPWGRLLVAKVLVVAGAGGIGTYNHRVLVPAMAEHPDDEALMARFRTIVSVEAGALLTAAALTAWLVGSAS